MHLPHQKFNVCNVFCHHCIIDWTLYTFSLDQWSYPFGYFGLCLILSGSFPFTNSQICINQSTIQYSKLCISLGPRAPSFFDVLVLSFALVLKDFWHLMDKGCRIQAHSMPSYLFQWEAWAWVMYTSMHTLFSQLTSGWWTLIWEVDFTPVWLIFVFISLATQNNS